MSTTIKNEAELKSLLVSMMVNATSDLKSASQSFEEEATYIFNVKPRNPEPPFDFPDPYINEYLLTIRVRAFGSPNPITLDEYIENFHYGDTHSSTINTEKEVITTHNLTTMICKIFISLKVIRTYPVIH
jgi:hypothetical protein